MENIALIFEATLNEVFFASRTRAKRITSSGRFLKEARIIVLRVNKSSWYQTLMDIKSHKGAYHEASRRTFTGFRGPSKWSVRAKSSKREKERKKHNLLSHVLTFTAEQTSFRKFFRIKSGESVGVGAFDAFPEKLEILSI
ncbi:hypothetical protein V1477_015699 [Vespula maculifrons]|uniref:Uncharacterized protein n=1 Tax=Vespula maculifrons TaxID=7453 RepID=A0ABD2BBH9_VESMC